MTAPAFGATQRKASVIAGLLFIYVIFGSILYMSFVRPKLILPGDAAATAKSLAAHELLFRIGTAHELLMAAGVAVLAWALYVLLKPIDENLALLALCLRLVEATLWSGSVLFSHALLQVVSDKPELKAFDPGQLHSLVGVLLRTSVASADLVILFTGLGTVVFCTLLFKSRYVPRLLAAWGIFTYSTMILFSCAKLIYPSLAALEMIVYLPGGLFEAVIGFWLLVKGLRARAD